jgi:hypothetical protein
MRELIYYATCKEPSRVSMAKTARNFSGKSYPVTPPRKSGKDTKVSCTVKRDSISLGGEKTENDYSAYHLADHSQA